MTPLLALDWDTEATGSRFTLRPACAVIVGEVSEIHLAKAGREQTAKELIRAKVGDWILEETPALGRPRVESGASGRGADAWVPILEWVVKAAAAGVVGALSWEATKIAALAMKDLVTRVQTKGVRLEISRGMAAFIAISEAANSLTPMADIEFIEEPSSIARIPSQELNYVGLEPWVVSLVDKENKQRHLVIVGPGGEIRGSLTTPLEDYELMYHHESDLTKYEVTAEANPQPKGIWRRIRGRRP